MRHLKFSEAIQEATIQSMRKDQNVIVVGLGVPDPKGIFGTTSGLTKIFGEQRVFDAPTSENALSGITLGAAISGLRPIITHQRVEFALLGIEQIINQAAKWSYQTAGKMCAPIVIRLIIGKGWGQGPQHSQSLESWFAHIPGLKVVMPSCAYDAKGLLISSVKDNNPVIFFEHRWLHSTEGVVPETDYEVEIGKAKVILPGEDLSIVTYGQMIPQALYCARILSKLGISLEIVDLRSLRPIDEETVLKSVAKTGRILAIDGGWPRCGIASEVITLVAINIFDKLKKPPMRCALEDVPIPSTRALANLVYPSVQNILDKCQVLLGTDFAISDNELLESRDVPESAFMGPF